MDAKLPPHDSESEKGMLGSLLLGPDLTGKAIDMVGTSGKVFYEEKHKLIYMGMVELFDDKNYFDVITLCAWLKDHNYLELCADTNLGTGYAYVSGLADCTPSAFNMEYYAEIVWDKYVLRETIKTCSNTLQVVHEAKEIDAFLDNFESDVMKIGKLRHKREDSDISSMVDQSLKEIEEMHMSGGQLSGVETGFGLIDELTGGLVPGDMIVLAARPSVGKTTLAINIAEHLAVDKQIPVAFVSLEMKGKLLVNRMLSKRCEIDGFRLRRGQLEPGEIERVVSESLKIRKAPLFIEDQRGVTMLTLKTRLRRLKLEKDIKIAFIDYMQLLTSGRRSDNRTNEVSQISSDIKTLAGDLDIPIVALSQLNRDQEKYGNRAPQLSDLRESGAIEQDADVVGFLWSPEQEDNDQGVRQVEFVIRKQRNGPTGKVNLNLIRKLTKFESVARQPWAHLPSRVAPHNREPIQTVEVEAEPMPEESEEELLSEKEALRKLAEGLNQ